MFLDISQKIALASSQEVLQTFFLLYSLILSRLLSLARIPSELCWKKPYVLHLTLFFLLLVSGYWGRFLFPRKNLLKSLRVGKFKEFQLFPSHHSLCQCAEEVRQEWGEEKGWMVTFKLSI